MNKKTAFRPCLWLLLIFCLLVSGATSAQDNGYPEIEFGGNLKPGQRVYYGYFEFDTVFPESTYDAYRNLDKTEGPISWIIGETPEEHASLYHYLYSEYSLFTMYINKNKYLKIADYPDFNVYKSDLHQSILNTFIRKTFSNTEHGFSGHVVFLPVNVGPGDYIRSIKNRDLTPLIRNTGQSGP